MLLARMLDRVIRAGKLTLIDANGRIHIFEGDRDGPNVQIRLTERSLHRRIPLRPVLAMGEAYMDGTLVIEAGSLRDFIEIFAMNFGWRHHPHWLPALTYSWRKLGRVFAQYNPVPRARRNVAHHYDLSDTLYDLFLDSDRQYSCAYFADPGDDLETAQLQKKNHIAAKLLLSPGQKILDIGSGWGGLGLHLAEVGRADVTGVTLSEQQHAYSNARAQRAGLGERVRFELRDYRQLDGSYDRIVSVGMFEHVGIRHYRAFFDKLNQLLANDGVALLHTIGRAEGPGATDPFVDKYIFPGGYSPALSEVTPVIERAGFYITDIEVLRLHYAETLRCWHENFQRNRDKVRAIYDERFCRMWEAYLLGAEMAFRHVGHVVFQIQLAKRQDAVPVTRDYITDYDRAAMRPAARVARTG